MYICPHTGRFVQTALLSGTLVLLGALCASESSATVIDFDGYVSANDNDFVNNFDENVATSVGGNYFQQTSGGITGGALVPREHGSYLNDVALYETDLPNGPGVTSQFGISLLYSESLINPIPTESIMITFDLRETDNGRRLRGELRSIGQDNLDVIFALTTNSASSRNEQPIPVMDLVDGHWYRFAFTLENVGEFGGTLNLGATVHDLGVTGLSTPQLVAQESLAAFDAIFSPSPQMELRLYSEQWAGTALLDDFSVSSVPEPGRAWLLAGAFAAVLMRAVRPRAWTYAGSGRR